MLKKSYDLEVIPVLKFWKVFRVLRQTLSVLIISENKKVSFHIFQVANT